MISLFILISKLGIIRNIPPLSYTPSCQAYGLHQKFSLEENRPGNVLIDPTLRCVRAATVAVEKQ
jgi:hypothetical protein